MPNDLKSKKTRRIFLLLRIAVVAAGIIWALVWLSKGQRWSTLSAIFLKMNLGVFTVTLFIFVIGQIIIGLRWWVLLRTQSVFIGFWPAMRLHFLGLFYSNFMPSAVGGDLIRAWYVTKHTDKRFVAALSVFVDRAIGLTSTLTIAVFFYAVFMAGHNNGIVFEGRFDFLEAAVRHKRVFIGVVAGAAVILGLFLLYRPSRARLEKVWRTLWGHGLKLMGKLRQAVVVYCSKPLVILAVFGLTVFMQIMVITGFWFLGRNLGITVSVKYYYVFFTLTWVMGALPISIGGAVVVEGLLAYLFIQFASVGAEAALALALCQRIVWMLTSLPGAAVHLVGAHLPKDFFIDYDGSMA